MKDVFREQWWFGANWHELCLVCRRIFSSKHMTHDAYARRNSPNFFIYFHSLSFPLCCLHPVATMSFLKWCRYDRIAVYSFVVGSLVTVFLACVGCCGGKYSIGNSSLLFF